MTTVNRQMSATAFAVRNNDVARYFDVSPYQIDILSVGDSILGAVTCMCLSVFGRQVAVRKSSLIVGFCLTAGNLLVTVGFLMR